MSFLWPWMLLLALVPASLLAAQLFMERRRRVTSGSPDPLPAVRRAFVQGSRVRALPADTTQRRIPWRFWLGFLLIVVALARPQWGMESDPASKPGEMVIALDLSRSMLATDSLPNRLERARTVANRLVDETPGGSIGLIGFAGAAYVLAAPSEDRTLLRTFLPAIRPEHMVLQGSNFASLTDAALNAFSPKATSRTLVLLSDGEAEPTPWRTRLPDLQAKGIRVVAVGFGTVAGAHILVGGRDIANAAGTAVTSHLNADSLREIARMTGGAYLDAAQSRELAAKVRDVSSQAGMANGDHKQQTRPDRFGWFLAAALLMLTWSATREWLAVPRMASMRIDWRRGAPASAIMVSALATTPPEALEPVAIKPPSITLELHGTEPDPLLVIKGIVAHMLGERTPTAQEYMALAQAAVRYGEVHRQHAHVLQLGVMRDGLAAIDTGRALDPGLPGWDDAHRRLIRLLRDPPPVNQPDKSPPDPANDPVDAKKNMPIPDPRQTPDSQKDGKQDKNQANQDQDSRKVGGTQRNQAEAAEWQVPSLVKPLYALQKLRGTDSPGELFRLIQMQQPAPAQNRSGEQTW